MVKSGLLVAIYFSSWSYWYSSMSCSQLYHRILSQFWVSKFLRVVIQTFLSTLSVYVSVRLLVCSFSVWTLKFRSYILKVSWQFSSTLFCNFTLCVQQFKQVKVLLLINTWARFRHYIIQVKLQCQPFSLSQGHIQNSLKPVQFLVAELRLHF